MKTILLFFKNRRNESNKVFMSCREDCVWYIFSICFKDNEKKGEAVWLLPLSVIDCLFLLYNQFLSVHCVSADDSDVVNAGCVVACVKFVCAFCHIVA